MSYIGKNPKLNSLTYTPQSADPSTPTEGMIFFSDGTSRAEGFWQYVNGEWLELGSGDAAGGINYILNPDFEGGVNGWATYADAAGAEPVDGTGGSPTLTFTRTTTAADVLRGDASGLITKDAADRQGEGVSYDLVVDNIDEEALLEFSFDFKAGTGFVTGESSDVRVFLYDIDNSELIVPADNYLLADQGSVSFRFLNTGTKNLRAIFHVATTNATAWTLSVDNVRVGPVEAAQGPIITDWVQYTPTFGSGLGTPTEVEFRYRRVGDSLEIQGNFLAGTVTSGEPTIFFPNSSWLTDSTYEDASTGRIQIVGIAARQVATSAIFGYGVGVNANENAIRLAVQTSTIPIGTRITNATQLATSGTYLTVEAKVKIAGWSANTTLSSTSFKRMSNLLANGTRVTATPARLGEYRTYVKSAASTAGTDTAPSAGWGPSAANGMRIAGSVNNATAGTAGQPGRWEIFVGRGKAVRWQFFSATGRAGQVSADMQQLSSTAAVGLNYGYNPNTGVAFVDGMTQLSSTTTRDAARSYGTGGAAPTLVDDVYFDIEVADPIASVASEAARHEVLVQGLSSTKGSTLTRTFRWQSVVSETGSAISYTDSATNGGTFTINEQGIYAITVNFDLNSDDLAMVVKNVTTDINRASIAADDLLAAEVPHAANNGMNMHVTLRLEPGDIIRLQTNAPATTGGSAPNQQQTLRIVKITD